MGNHLPYQFRSSPRRLYPPAQTYRHHLTWNIIQIEKLTVFTKRSIFCQSFPKKNNMSNKRSNYEGSDYGQAAFGWSQSSNVMDENSMPSDKAEAARKRSEEIMAALRKGEKGDANALMGKSESAGRGMGLGWLPNWKSNKGK